MRKGSSTPVLAGVRAPSAKRLTAFREGCLGTVLDVDTTLRDEREALATVVGLPTPEGRWRTGPSQYSEDRVVLGSHNLVTLHSAKRLEFRVVIMMGMEQGRIPRWNAGDVTRREQRRLFYVGLSRAKDEVHMTYSGWTRNQYGRRFVNGPSEFLAEVRDQLE